MRLNPPLPPNGQSYLARLDRLQSRWADYSSIPRSRLRRVEEAARIQSIGASCRLAGIRVADTELPALLNQGGLETRDRVEIQGYARALALPPMPSDRLLDAEELARVHAVILGEPPEDATASPWRSEALYREAFDAQGQATGCVFPTLPPHMVAEKTQELTTWLEYELRSGEQHPVMVIGGFVLCMLATSPFQKASGRLARLMVPRLLRRTGYSFVSYGSFEAQIEKQRDAYYQALSRSQTRLWTEQANLEPWFGFFLAAIDRYRARIEAKLELERDVTEFPPLQQQILEAVREHGNVDAALLIRATGANRNTLKDNLRRLVERGVLERTGQRRAARYRLSAGGQPGGYAEH